MINFINQVEEASYVDNAARNEVVTDSQTGAVTIYSGTPDIKDPLQAETGIWTICRTIVTTDETGTVNVDTSWAQGLWTDRATLTYNYL